LSRTGRDRPSLPRCYPKERKLVDQTGIRTGDLINAITIIVTLPLAPVLVAAAESHRRSHAESAARGGRAESRDLLRKTVVRPARLERATSWFVAVNTFVDPAQLTSPEGTLQGRHLDPILDPGGFPHRPWRSVSNLRTALTVKLLLALACHIERDRAS
jgi:hypothetical protein